MPETSPTHHWQIPKTPPKKQQNNTKTTPRHQQKRQRQDRDTTETWPRHHQNNTETSPRQDQDKTKTRPRQDRDTTETRPRQDRDILGEFFPVHARRPAKSRLWAQADFSADFFSKPRGVKINLFPPPVMSFFLSLTIRRLVMHIWNWFETHSAACWCGMEREVTTKKFTKQQQVMKSLEVWCMRPLINRIVKSDRWMVLQVQSCARAVTATHVVMGEQCQKVRWKQKRATEITKKSMNISLPACRLANIIQRSEVQE